MNKRLAKMICTTLALGCIGMPGVQAEESPEFSLDKVIVTALRAESTELETPASVTVKTGDELKATGALTVVDALQFIEGINMYSQGPNGQSAGRMSSEVTIRGAKKGTLIMVNGAPINMNGLFQLDNILLENVEKVEVIRGANSVMYGSEAFGGVINIITKKQVANSISSSIGSYGRHSHSLNLQAGKLAFSGSLVDGGKTEKITSTSTKYTNYTGSEKISLNGAYRFTDKLMMNYTHSEDDIDKQDRLISNNSLDQYSNDKESVDRLSFQYQDKAFRANVYGTFREIDYYTRKSDGSLVYSMPPYPTSATVHTNLKTAKYGLDTNREWEIKNNKYLAGITLETEEYEQNSIINTKASGPAAPVTTYLKTGPFERNVIALYAQATHQIDDARKLILGVRGQQTEADGTKKYNQLLPQLQYNQKIGDSSSWFVNMGKAFRLPTLTEMYVTSAGRFKGNPNLDPQTGWTYETGWKKQTGEGLLKTTVFMMDIDDYIETDNTTDKQYQNFDKYKNQGIEISWEQKLSDKYSYTVGGSYSNPRAYYNNQWQRMYGRIQGTFSIRYQQDKLSAYLSANYTADRANDAPPAFPVSLVVNYKVKPETTLFATMRNVLNRHDVTTESKPSAMSGHFYGAPRTVEFGVKHTF